MDEYTQLVKKYVGKFQPKLESKLEVELGKIEVKKNSNIQGRMMQGGNFNQDKTDILLELEVNEKFYTDYKRRLQEREKELIFSPSKIVNFDIQTDTIHELAHMFQIKRIWNRMQQIKSMTHTEEEIKPFKQFFSDGYKFPKCFHSFQEGFATYMAYDSWSWIYDKDLKASRNLEIEKKILLSGPSVNEVTKVYGIKHDPYYEGYKFFRNLDNRFDFPTLMELSTVPPKNLGEIRNSNLYLQRVYPQLLGV